MGTKRSKRVPSSRGTGVNTALLQDIRAAGIDPQTVSGSWTKQNLNTKVYDPDGIVDLNTSVVTLRAGTYLFEWSVTSCHSSGTATPLSSRIRNMTDSATVATAGGSSPANANYCSHSSGSGKITISSTKTFEIQIIGANGGGTYPNTGDVNTFASLKITKLPG